MKILRILVFFVFIGRAWQHLFWDVPFRELLWDEEKMSGIVAFLFKTDWAIYISSPSVNFWIDNTSVVWGVFYIICAVATLLFSEQRKWLGGWLIAGSVSLFLLSLLYWLEKFMSIGQLLELTLQVGSPLILYFFIKKPSFDTLFFIKIIIALTFIGHGSYALGWYPVPAHFVQMMIDGFGVNEVNALLFLKIVGVVDIIAAIGLFVPALIRVSLWYCIIWGILTAFARLVANWDMNIPLETLHRWWFEVAFRLVHGGIPLLTWRMVTSKHPPF